MKNSFLLILFSLLLFLFSNSNAQSNASVMPDAKSDVTYNINCKVNVCHLSVTIYTKNNGIVIRQDMTRAKALIFMRAQVIEQGRTVIGFDNYTYYVEYNTGNKFYSILDSRRKIIFESKNIESTRNQIYLLMQGK